MRYLQWSALGWHGSEADYVAEVDGDSVVTLGLHLVSPAELLGHRPRQHFKQQSLWNHANNAIFHRNEKLVLREQVLHIRGYHFTIQHVREWKQTNSPVFFFSSTSWSVLSSTSCSKLLAYFSIIAIMLSKIFGFLFIYIFQKMYH